MPDLTKPQTSSAPTEHQRAPTPSTPAPSRIQLLLKEPAVLGIPLRSILLLGGAGVVLFTAGTLLLRPEPEPNNQPPAALPLEQTVTPQELVPVLLRSEHFTPFSTSASPYRLRWIHAARLNCPDTPIRLPGGTTTLRQSAVTTPDQSRAAAQTPTPRDPWGERHEPERSADTPAPTCPANLTLLNPQGVYEVLGNRQYSGVIIEAKLQSDQASLRTMLKQPTANWDDTPSTKRTAPQSDLTDPTNPLSPLSPR